MSARALVSLVGALFVTLALVSASGAATTKEQKVVRIDVSTRAAVIQYLRSVHVNPNGAVIQRGDHNFAGAHCPGRGWTCANAHHTVVQIATRGGVNRFVCRGSNCSVVQFSGASGGMYTTRRLRPSTTAPTATNSAVCIKTSGLAQACTISQSIRRTTTRPLSTRKH